MILNGDFSTATVALTDKSSVQLSEYVVMSFGIEGLDPSSHNILIPWTSVLRVTAK